MQGNPLNSNRKRRPLMQQTGDRWLHNASDQQTFASQPSSLVSFCDGLIHSISDDVRVQPQRNQGKDTPKFKGKKVELFGEAKIRGKDNAGIQEQFFLYGHLPLLLCSR